MALPLARDRIERVAFVMRSSARGHLVDMVSATLPFKPPPERRNVHEIHREQHNNEGEAACRNPERPLHQSHVPDIRGVHAENARDERQWQEYHGDDREDDRGVFTPILHSGDLRSSLLPCQNCVAWVGRSMAVERTFYLVLQIIKHAGKLHHYVLLTSNLPRQRVENCVSRMRIVRLSL